MKPESVTWVKPRQLKRYLEHDGTINDEEYGYPGAYLDMLAEARVPLDSTCPIILSVDKEAGKASISDGNHRLILALEWAKTNKDLLVPLQVTAEPSTHPGFDYQGELGWPTKPPMRKCVRRKTPALTEEAKQEARRQAEMSAPPTAETMRSVMHVVRGRSVNWPRARHTPR